VDFKALGMSTDGARFKVRHEFHRPGGPKVARIVLAGGWMDLTRRKLASPPADLARLLASLERVEPYEVLPNAKKREA
jgi:acyl-CoA thioester hydrolase